MTRWISTTLILLGVFAFALTAGDAEARKRRGSKKPAPQSVESTANETRDNNTLCNGGMMVTADDQIRGCSGLIKSGRLNRDLRATALYNRGNAYVAKSDFGRAISDYTEALGLKSDYPQAYFNRAVAYRISGNPQTAIGDYTSVLALTPGDADAFAGRGSCYAALSKHAQALEDFNRALTIKPGHLPALVQRGHAYVRAHQWASAISDYEAAVAISTAAVEAIYGRGVARIYSGDVRGGQGDISQAMVIDSGVTARMTTQGIPPPQILRSDDFKAPAATPPQAVGTPPSQPVAGSSSQTQPAVP